MTKRFAQKAGLPPGTLMHVGNGGTGECSVYVAEYDETTFAETGGRRFIPPSSPPAAKRVTWIHVSGLHDPTLIESIGAAYNIHPLVLEDILNTLQRPKMENFDDYAFLTCKRIAGATGERKELHLGQFSVILREHTVISFQDTTDDFLAPVKTRLREDKGRIRKMGADYLVYSLLDFVVDQYFVALEELAEQTDAIEEALARSPSETVMRRTHALKRSLASARKSVWPLRDLLAALAREGGPPFTPECRPYLRDLYDHVIQINDAFETMRDVVSGLLDLYLSSLSHKTNETMKVLTIIATLFIPLTFIVGVYGMNFEHMPELKWQYGYPAVWLLMLALATGMLWHFRRKKWL